MLQVLPPKKPSRDQAWLALIVLTLTAGLAATLDGWLRTDPSARRPQNGWQAQQFSVNTAGFSGLSDLCRDEHQQLWSVPERGHALLRLAPSGASALGLPVAVAGLPQNVDVEAIASLGDGQFALGCETRREGRPSDPIIFVALGTQPAPASVREVVEVPYAMWPVHARGNEGIEGLCYARGHLLISVESTATWGKQRLAPLALLNLQTRKFSPLWLQLTSAVGKIAGLACRQGTGGDVEVLAIERHFGVMRLLHFTLSLQQPGPQAALAQVAPEILYDFSLDPQALPNFEGVTWLADGRIVLLSDNDYGGVTGPTQGLYLTRLPLVEGHDVAFEQ